MAKGDFALYDSRFTETRDKLIELESGVFDILMDVLCFAAGLGFEKNITLKQKSQDNQPLKMCWIATILRSWQLLLLMKEILR